MRPTGLSSPAPWFRFLLPFSSLIHHSFRRAHLTFSVHSLFFLPSFHPHSQHVDHLEHRPSRGVVRLSPPLQPLSRRPQGDPREQQGASLFPCFSSFVDELTGCLPLRPDRPSEPNATPSLVSSVSTKSALSSPAVRSLRCVFFLPPSGSSVELTSSSFDRLQAPPIDKTRWCSTFPNPDVLPREVQDDIVKKSQVRFHLLSAPCSS
jgi:hypothetical protein